MYFRNDFNPKCEISIDVLKYLHRIILNFHPVFEHSIPTDKTANRKVASSNTSRLEAHAGFFRLLMKGIFNTYL